jgi:hypothetical protein
MANESHRFGDHLKNDWSSTFDSIRSAEPFDKPLVLSDVEASG